MSYLYGSIPFEVFICTCIFCIPLGIFLFFYVEKTTPGHPAKYLSLAISFIGPILGIARYAEKYAYGSMFYSVTEKVALVSCVLFLVGVLVMFYFANKLGYTNPEKVKKVMPLMKSAALMMVLGIAVLLFLHHT